MRDIFTDVFKTEPMDPVQSARRGARPKLTARFYNSVAAGETGEDGVPILLDGKPVRTPAKALLAAPSRALAQALAAEWDAQRDLIDPARMPLTRLANAIIDGVVKTPAPVTAVIEKYLGSDLLFYRAGEPEELIASQARHWDPILQWAHETFGARFVLGQGITFVAQPAEAVAAAAGAIPKHPWRLGAVNSATALTGSALLALALAHNRLDPGAAWAAAHVDEDWNMAKWGRDEQALERRTHRFAEMQAAAQVLSTTQALSITKESS
ncbi:MAG: ATP12 family protein [Xanthobacteraceae bacterium]|jgi:chaperone required for assembly of F1-ATPase|nr:ATP12 family protein [Xanthobacteraceae bacterium]